MPVAEHERIVDIFRPNPDAKLGDPPSKSKSQYKLSCPREKLRALISEISACLAPWIFSFFVEFHFVIAVVRAASATQLMNAKQQLENATLQRQWALFEPNTVFTVRKNRDPEMDEYPELTIAGGVGYPIGLVSGRWLQYQVRDSQPEDERGFVTVVRYTPECPTGKATALFNWKSGAVEVTLGENVILVLLLQTVTALAVHDLLGTMSKRPTKVTKKTILPHGAEWGKIQNQLVPPRFNLCAVSASTWWDR